MKASRFKNHIYTQENIVFRQGRHVYIESDDGTLFSGNHRTKILAQDLPEWYAFGRYYKRLGYMSTKGITDLLYQPCHSTNHFLKDDFLYVAYGGKIEEATPEERQQTCYRYKGFGECVWGNEIITILKGARQYSDQDISGIVRQLKDKQEWLLREYPEQFSQKSWDFDVDACFAEPFDNRLPPQYYSITLEDHFCPSFISSAKRYYGTLEDIRAFIGSLDYDRYQSTVDAFRRFLTGDPEAAHYAGQVECKLLEPVTFIKSSFLYTGSETWSFRNVWDHVYTMKLDNSHMDAILLKDGEEYLRCICPVVSGLCYQVDSSECDDWTPVRDCWGHPGILTFDDKLPKELRARLYLAEKRYDNVKSAVAELNSVKPCLDAVCEEVFADG